VALAAHRRGIVHLLQGDPRAAVHDLRAAIGEDPCFLVGHVDLSLALAEVGAWDPEEGQRRLDAARSCARTLSRYERHHAEVVALALDGRVSRATALALEHLADYPDDEVVCHLLAQLWEPEGR
jgi:hypothetical protein